MKRISVSLFILLSISFLVPFPHTSAFSECRSEKNGYCVRFDPQDAPKNTQRNTQSLFFASAHGPPFPGLEFLDTYGIGYNTKIGALLSAIYNFGVAIAGVSALIIFTFGGILYLTSAGSPAQTNKARGHMTNALIGLALIAGSYLIFYTINPDLTRTLSNETIPSLKKP